MKTPPSLASLLLGARGAQAPGPIEPGAEPRSPVGQVAAAPKGGENDFARLLAVATAPAAAKGSPLATGKIGATVAAPRVAPPAAAAPATERPPVSPAIADRPSTSPGPTPRLTRRARRAFARNAGQPVARSEMPVTADDKSKR